MYIDAISDQIDVEDLIDSRKLACWNGHSMEKLTTRDDKNLMSFLDSL